MAKKNKKPRHSNLVLPSDGIAKKRQLASELPPEPALQEEVSYIEEKAIPKPTPPKKQKPKTKQQLQQENLPDPLPENAIVMPLEPKAKQQTARYIAAQKKKNKRRIRMMIVFLLSILVALFYLTDMYQVAFSTVQDGADSVKVAFQPGEGFPMELLVSGYKTALPMGSGFAVLGEQDMALISSSGRETKRVQHGFVYPGVSTGNNRSIIYNQGSQEFIITSKTDVIKKDKLPSGEILFAEMSPGGWVAMVTSTRFNANIKVYNPVYDMAGKPEFTWTLTDDRPILAAFHPDNRNLALGCLTVKDGAVNSTIHLLRVDKENVQATIYSPDARIIKASFIRGGNLMIVYDTYTALYNTKGEELERYDYGNNKLQMADISSGQAALIFGADSRDFLKIILLGQNLVPVFETTTDKAPAPKVLADGKGVYLLAGSEVMAFDYTGQQKKSLMLTTKPLGLVNASQPLVLSVGKVTPLSSLLDITKNETQNKQTSQEVSSTSTSATQ